MDNKRLADIATLEEIVGFVLNIGEVSEVARIGQFVKIDDAVVGILVHEQAHNMRADKSRTAGDNYSFPFQSVCHNTRYTSTTKPS